MSFALDKKIEFDESRCWECGAYWAVERRRQSRSECPGCAFDKTGERNIERLHLERQVRSLRGVITRMKAVRS